MGASGSVIKLETLSADEVGKYVSNIGKEFKGYKAILVERGINGERLSHMKTNEEIMELLKSLGIKNANHQKVLCTHLQKLISSFQTAHAAEAGPAEKRRPFPREGVRLNVFHEFIMACGGREVLKGMKTKDVCDRFVKPKTQRLSASYCDLLKSQNHTGVGTAVVYISHSWSLAFLDVVDSLDCHYGRTSDIVVWFDLFCYNQHHSGSTSFEHWSSLIKSANVVFKNTLVVLSPWQNPTPLSRAWCVYEICSAIENKCSLEIALSKSEEDSFVETIRNDFESFDEIAVTIDARSVYSTHATDKTRVLDEVQKSVGLTAINRVVCDLLREWTIRTMKKAVVEEVDQDSKLDLKITLGALLRNSGRYAEAEPLLKESLEAMQRDLGPEHPDTLAAMNNLASIYESEGRYEAAEPLLVNCLAISNRVLGPDDPITMTVTSSLADVYSSQQKYVEAEPLYIECLRASVEMLGAEHPDTLTSKNNLAYLYVCQGKFDEAEPILTSCLDERSRELGPDHPDTLASMHNLAYLYKSQKKYASAEPLYQRCLDMQRIKSGEEHPNTLSSMCGLASVYECQGKLDLAEPLYIEATEKGKVILGASHPHVQEWKQNYEKFLRRKNAIKNVTRSGSSRSINGNSSRRILL